MIGEKLSGFYLSLEDKWFKMLDWLDSKGLPVYAYSDFLENRGIPSFPFTIAIIAIIAFLLFGIFAIGSTINPAIALSISDQYNDSVSGALITVKNAQGGTITTKTMSSGSTLQLQGIPLGATLTIVASKEGYDSAEEELLIAKESQSLAITMNKKVSLIDAQVLLQDAISGDPVSGAKIIATYKTISREATTGASGSAVLQQIPEATSIALEISSDAYETISDNFSFTRGEAKTIPLQPKSISLAGKSRLAISITDEQGNLVKGAEITISDNGKDSIIYQATAANGTYSADIEKGTSTRLMVEKEGFLRYDSTLENTTRTMRLDEESWQVILQSGGKGLTVKVLTEAGAPIAGAAVQLFSSDSTLLDSVQSAVDGTTQFGSLAGEKFFVTAFAEGYLPKRIELDLAAINSAEIKLAAADTTNSSFLSVYVIDSQNAVANNADIFFFENVAGTELPLGIPPMKTDLSGYAGTRLRIGTDAVAKAKRGIEAGTGEKTILANTLNELRITLEKNASIAELLVLDEFGSPVQGNITITSPEGDLLFDGNIGSDGKVFFDSQGKTHVNVEIITLEGKTFSEQVNLAADKTATVRLGKQATGFSPEVTFLGVFDDSGNKVEGIVPGKYFWLKFETAWPSGNYSGGLHARIGSDYTKFVDSEEAGIMGFDATTNSFATGKSYQPLPEPGNETADKQNKAALGDYAKWIELYFEKPANTVVSRIKIKAKESIESQKIEMHYRAWSAIGGSYYRFPEDSSLGTAKYISTKTSLYAETKTETISIVQSVPECKKDLCASYYFLQKDGLLIETAEFKPLLNGTYALEIDLSSQKQATAQISLETGTPALLYFTGYDTDIFQNTPQAWEKTALPSTTNLNDANVQGTTSGYLTQENQSGIAQNSNSTLLFADTATAAATSSGYLNETPIVNTPEAQQNPFGFSENSSTNTKLSIAGVNIVPNQTKKIRAYFKTVDSGEAYIKTDIAAAGVALGKTINFTIPMQKEFAVTVSPADISVGQDFSITLEEKTSLEKVSNAAIHLLDSGGKTVFSVVGNNTKGKGLDGKYDFKNNFSPGKYTAEISAQDFLPSEEPITISIDNLLQIPKEIRISVSKGLLQGEKTANILNKGKQDIQGITYEITTGDNFPEEFFVSMDLPASMSANQSALATAKVSVNLSESSADSLHGEADVAIMGTVAGQFPTKTKTKIIIDYNKKLAADCLKFDSAQLQVKLIGTAGSTAQTSVGIENTCETELTLTPQIEAQAQDPNLSVTASPVTIAAGAKQAVPVTVSNSIDRIYSMQQTFSFNITFDSPQVSKSILLDVELWNPISNLAFPPQMSLFLSQLQGQNIASDSQALMLTNTGQEPITSFRLAVDDTAYRQYGITAYLAPTGMDYGFLAPGSALSPQRYLVAQTSNPNALPGPIQGAVHYTGVVMNRQMDFGTTSVSVNYPGSQCLELSAKTSIAFESQLSYGTQKQSITVKNSCGEEVRVREILPASIGSNALYLLPPDFTVPANSEQEFGLQLTILQQMNKTEQIRVKGYLVRSQKWTESNPLAVRISIGEKKTTGPSLQGSKIKMKVCENMQTEKEITFPKTGDCITGYCDAKTFATVLAEKIQKLVQQARSKATTNAGKTYNLTCNNQSYCTFADLGVKSEPFRVYVQLDSMTPGLLEQVIAEKKITEIETYDVQKRTDIVDEKALGLIAEGGFIRNIYLGTDFEGCGTYVLNIYGAIQAINNEIIKDNFMILVKPEIASTDTKEQQARTDTPECTSKIQNIANFLPVDEGLSSSSYNIAWPGIVVYGTPNLETAGNAIAKQLFKADKGRAVADLRTTNNLKIIIGNNNDALAKISIENVSGTQPKTITANLRPGIETSQEKASEAGAAIKSIMSGAPSSDTCISEDESYMLIKSYETPDAPLSIDGPKKIAVSGVETSIELTVTGKAGEEVTLSTNFLDSSKQTTGIDYIKIVDAVTEKTLLTEYAGGNSEATNNVLKLNPLQSAAKPAAATGTPNPAGTAPSGTGAPTNPPATAPPAKTAQAEEQEKVLLADAATGTQQAKPATGSAKIKFIVKGSVPNPSKPETAGSSFVFAPSAVQSITLSAEPIAESQKSRATQGFEITISTCGLYAPDLVGYVNDASPKKDEKIAAYATIGWKDAPDQVDYDYLAQNILSVKTDAAAAQAVGAAPGTDLANVPEIRRDMAWKGLGATWIGYALPCSLMALLLNWWNGEVRGAADIALVCVAPATWASKDLLKDMGPDWKKGVEFVEEITKTIIKFIPLIGSPIANTLFPASAQNAVPVTSEAQQQTPASQDVPSFGEQMGWPAGLGISMRSVTSGITRGWDTITPTSASETAKELRTKFMAELRKTTFKDLGESEWKLLTEGKTSMGQLFEDRVRINLLQYQGKPKIVEGKYIGQIRIGDVVADATQKSIPEIGPDLVTYIQRYNLSSDPNWPKKLNNLLTSERLDLANKTLSMEGIQGPQIEAFTTQEQSGLAKFKTTTRQKWVASVRSQIETKLNATADGRKLISDGIMNDVDDIIKSKRITYTTPTLGRVQIGDNIYPTWTVGVSSDLDQLSRSVVGEAQKKVEQRIVSGTIGQSTFREFSNGLFNGDEGKGLQNAAKEVFETGSAKTRGQRFLQAAKDFFSKKFFNWQNLKTITWGMVKGAGMGFVEMWAGQTGYKEWWEKIGTDPNVPINKVVPTPQSQQSGAAVSASSFIIIKNNTYKIEITGTGEKTKTISFAILQTPAEFEEMAKAIADKKAALWQNSNCNDFLEKELKPIGQLKPNYTAGFDARYVAAYINNNTAFALARIGDATNPADNVPESEIIALMTVKPEKTDCRLTSEWDKQPRETIKSYVTCVAQKLRQNKTRTFEQYAQELSKGDKEYYDAVTTAQKNWQATEITTS